MNTAVKENSVKTFFLKLKKLWQNFTTKVSEWMDKGNRTTVIFLLPYVLMFMVFIVLPIIIAIALSFTYFGGFFEKILSLLPDGRNLFSYPIFIVFSGHII